MARDAKATSSEDVTEQLETLRADIAALSQTMSDFAKQRAGDFAERSREEFTHRTQAAAKSAADLSRQAEDAVRAQPMTATAIAAGIGFVLGYISHRR
ncbi:DUF883 domain-containing protein [Rhodobacteraceae bacterium LMO-12]|nr:DUF883 domain-containing protein [Rhodobacteraceae bacterium LMO-JJ12]